MNLQKLNCLIVFVLFITVGAQAQQKADSSLLTLEDAIRIAMQNNYDILVMKNNQEISDNNNTWGNAGALPQLAFQSTGNWATNNTKQNLLTGQSIDKRGVKSNALTTGLYATWTVFDGLKMFATKDRLSTLEDIGHLNVRSQVETTLQQLITAYYQVVCQKQLIKGLEESYSVSEERIKIADKKLSVGSGSNVELFQAKTDFNAQKSNLIQQRQALIEYKVNLNVLMSRDADTPFDIPAEIAHGPGMDYQQVKERALKNNVAILISQANRHVSEAFVKEVRSQGLPRIALNANYIFSRSSSQAGLTLLNQNLGLNYGFTASWMLFNGGQIYTQVQNAKLSVLNSGYDIERNRLQVASSVAKAYERFVNNLEILKLEEDNMVMAEENMKISTERFKQGLSNYLELKEVQRSYEEAVTRLVTARYNVKISETDLQRLQGELVK